MSSNFFVDFALFNILGLLAGLDWMIAFSAATFLAMITRHFQLALDERRLREQRVRPNFEGLPAYRKDRQGRRHRR
ncbi:MULTISPECIES: hypothetical protein [unclassified Roseitalea]|uniref:hypothetical protein n=1 Tax=unclassified Roseitalea TaxID=2639107 RepID=UPI00273F84EB|nr:MULTISPECIES: hypothetical protein [unclassified Roseitalea]